MGRESGAINGTPQALQQVMISRRLSLQGGFLLVYGGDKRMFASFNAPPGRAASLFARQCGV